MSVSRECVYGDDGHVDGVNDYFHGYRVDLVWLVWLILLYFWYDHVSVPRDYGHVYDTFARYS